MSFLGHAGNNFFKIAVSLIGLIVVFYILIEFRLWSADWTGYFLKRGGFEEIIFVSLIVAGVSIVVLKLYSWHLRIQTGGR